MIDNLFELNEILRRALLSTKSENQMSPNKICFIPIYGPAGGGGEDNKGSFNFMR